ncbi:MAG: peptidase domain-containing ABC transporter, partial [Synechococcus sp.]|nr:peptidase domain-containing ABC transporter [Synechococcus sp.]
ITAVRSLIFTGIANRVDMDTRETILDRLVRLPQGFFDARPVGQITYYFTQLDRLRDFLISKALTTLVDFSFSLLYLAVLLSLNPLLTLITLSSLPLFIVLALIANPVVEHQIDRVVHEGVNTNSYLTEAITGIQTIKSQNAELKTRWAFQDRYSRFIGEDFKLKVSGETVGALAKCIGDLSGIATMVVGIWLVSRNELSIGALFAFRIIGDRVTGPLVQLVQTWQQFKIQSRNLKLAADVVDRPTEQSESGARNIPMPPVQGAVTIRNVDFRYTDDGPAILHNVSLDVPQGTFVGMVGGSGSGKSTLLKLLPRFYSPESGQIQIDGLDVSKVELYSLRRQIGVVPQDSLLFDGTIKENLLMVKPDATSEELMRAARIACAHDFIMELPEGYNSSVGERGAGLSGGQRQRMALARAVLQNPSMLILDEATSALDARTERQVCRNLFEAFRGRTVFFITHRLSTVRPADMIVVMDQGAVMEIGDHASLLERQGWYYALYQCQAQEGLS